jgi:hypothetical protein
MRDPLRGESASSTRGHFSAGDNGGEGNWRFYTSGPQRRLIIAG